MSSDKARLELPEDWTKEYVEQLFWDKGITEQPPYVSVMDTFF